MCNLYSETKGQAAIRALFRTAHDTTGNLPAFPGIFPDQLAPIVRNSVDGERELVMARWGMPGPPQFGGQPVPNIHNVASPQTRRWDMLSTSRHNCALASIVVINSNASSISGNSCVGANPCSAGARTAWASAERPVDW
jgi:putative SOS response-associated peptidase YedK